ncbi:hypothetical protein HDU83_008907 [Entophlyctis luteolus]|nr:hypothetical protein HDU82_009093 [Entophlyctis luteolus]KAJ3337176.1 hypothetical protein HDU83_008907 [Entophlyctis luteolus]
MGRPNPSFASDVATVNALLDACAADRSQKKHSKFNSIKLVRYSLPLSDGSVAIVCSFNCPEAKYKEGSMPTMARGLFALELPDFESEKIILVRGYDKFFNLGEVPATNVQQLKEDTIGPYEITVKENGCIIYVSAYKGTLIVTSKHAMNAPLLSTGQQHTSERKISHAQKGEEWVIRHISLVHKTANELAKFLEEADATAVFELADDDFEEHILEYPEGRRGLYLHGVNQNSSQLETWPNGRVSEFGRTFGFFNVDCETFTTFDEMFALAEKCKGVGSYLDRPVEGFVVRCTAKLSNSVTMFKIKFDEPYLMFRNWREITKRLISGLEPQPRYVLSETYASWCQRKLATNPELFDQYSRNKGIIAIRNLFLRENQIEESWSNLLREAQFTIAPETSPKRELAKIVFPEKLPPPSALAGSEKIIILPISVVGQGKSTLGSVLKFLFHSTIAEVQSDNYAKKGPWLSSVLDNLEKRNPKFQPINAVYADRCNHLDIHRAEVSSALKRKYPGARILAIEWDVRGGEEDDAVKMSIDRIIKRGEKHRKLTPQKKPDFEKVVRRFFKEFMPLDDNAGSLDSTSIDARIKISLYSSVKERVEAVCNALGWPMDEARLNEKLRSLELN